MLSWFLSSQSTPRLLSLLVVVVSVTLQTPTLLLVIFGLFADGTSGDEFTGITTGTKIADVDTFQVFGVRDEDAAVRKPFDGQGAFFKINLDDYH